MIIAIKTNSFKISSSSVEQNISEAKADEDDPRPEEEVKGAGKPPEHPAAFMETVWFLKGIWR